MAAPAYTEFDWHTADAGNTAFGEALTEVFAGIVQKLDGVTIAINDCAFVPGSRFHLLRPCAVALEKHDLPRT